MTSDPNHTTTKKKNLHNLTSSTVATETSLLSSPPSRGSSGWSGEGTVCGCLGELPLLSALLVGGDGEGSAKINKQILRGLGI